MHRPSRSSAQKSHQEMHEAFWMCWTYCTGTGTGDHCVFFIFKSIKRHGMCKRRSYEAPSEKSDFCQVFPKSFCWFFLVGWLGWGCSIYRILNVHHLGNIFFCACNHAHKLSCICIHT